MSSSSDQTRPAWAQQLLQADGADDYSARVGIAPAALAELALERFIYAAPLSRACMALAGATPWPTAGGNILSLCGPQLAGSADCTIMGYFLSVATQVTAIECARSQARARGTLALTGARPSFTLCHVDSVGAHALAEGLKTNTTLHCLKCVHARTPPSSMITWLQVSTQPPRPRGGHGPGERPAV